MRKVTLSMKAQDQYEVIKRLAEGHMTKFFKRLFNSPVWRTCSTL